MSMDCIVQKRTPLSTIVAIGIERGYFHRPPLQRYMRVDLLVTGCEILHVEPIELDVKPEHSPQSYEDDPWQQTAARKNTRKERAYDGSGEPGVGISLGSAAAVVRPIRRSSHGRRNSPRRR
ncbi:hypothetical protein Mapa_015366 [Marchantia paleacea]|nr:hypothetical protein Mapa_015366 [Marchantia paleacea]